MLRFRTFTAIFLFLVATPQWDAKADDDSLAPPDTSSPRATLKSFLSSFEDAFRPLVDGQSDRVPYSDPAYVRAFRTLDTSELPPAEQRRSGGEASVLIYEVLSRVELPAYDQVPDAETMDALPLGEPKRWRVPKTELEIRKVEEGPRTGEYLFSPTTVELAKEFYERIRYREYRPGTIKRLYERVSYWPGANIPIHWIEGLPPWAKHSIWGQSVWKWGAMAALGGLWALIAVLAHRWSRSSGRVHRYWQRSLLALALMLLTREFRLILEQQVVMSHDVFNVVGTIALSVSYYLGAVVVVNVGAGITRASLDPARNDGRSIDDQITLLLGQLVTWLVVLGLVLMAANQLGIPLAAVFASLGIGGVAVALAARPTLENLIAGVTLIFDRPVRIGEWCQFRDVCAVVERIGLRSTRLRRWDGNLISVPNSQFVEHQLDNYDDVRDIFIRKRLHLRLDTTPEQLRYLLVKLREMLVAHPKVRWSEARLRDFGASFLVVELRCYADTTAWNEYRAIQEDILLRAMEIIREAGSALAIPAQATYFARAEAPDPERQRASEEQVKEWREAGKLPFPDSTMKREEELAGTLDYPPRGSILMESGAKGGGETKKV